MQVTKVDKMLSQKMTVIGNQVQNLTEKLLTPFSANNINMEVFFQDVAKKVRQIEKKNKEMRLGEIK
jgi:hypothetical protein